jgi:hypothetical protein
MYEIPGYASAQRAWENMEPAYAEDCTCDSRFECEECGDDAFTAADLGKEHVECVGARIVEVEHGLTVASCREHGGCTGCFSKWCEDCNG